MDQDNNSEDESVGPSEDDAHPRFPLGLSDSEAVEVLWQVRAQRRQTNPDLPDTVTRLTTPEGSVVYLVGTAHFSDSSKKDVATVGLIYHSMRKSQNSEHWSTSHIYNKKLVKSKLFLFKDVEKCKQKDLLEQTMSEMIGEFPALHRTIVAERDIYLTHTLRQAARCVEAPHNAQKVPAVVVGVVGMGHVPGIEKNWDKELNIHEIMSVAPPSRVGWVLRTALKGAVLGALGYACYRAGGGVGRALLSLPAVQSNYFCAVFVEKNMV
uniref:TraB domain containing n=1 Tax=Astyanax mexicanus TaxID=7994 RepID=A0A8B9L386_ASTMX